MDTLLTPDYRLGGEADRQAVAAGLADATWYQSPVDPEVLRSLTRRTNKEAAVNSVLYFSLLIGSGIWAYSTLWSWWTVPALFVYGTLYGSSADPRWHECGHGTAFRTGWLNDLVYYPASFMMLRDPTVWRWSHVRHHSDTIVVGRDPEVVLRRPPQIHEWVMGLFSLSSGPKAMRRTVVHATGRISAADRSYIPQSAQRKVQFEAMGFVAIWGAVLAWCIVSRSATPLLFFVGPSFYGAWLVHMFGTTQHLGLQENVLDHRLNTRTVYMNPVLRFLYWNMNYHCEHHMYPTVPSHALPKLHQAIKDDLVTPTPSVVAAYREIVPALLKQRRDPTYEIPRVLPQSVGRPSRPGDTATSERRLEAIPTEDPNWFVACAIGELADGELARVDIGERTFVLCSMAGEFHLLDGICTHSRKVHLAGGLIVDGQIECPKHNGRFDVCSGGPTRAPVSVPLGSYPVEIRDQQVHVRITSEDTL